MLPFPKKDDRRKWQCFVCGREFAEYEPFREHILKDHEEGREYVICPLARCGAPVRDLKLHYRAKHPHDKMPKGSPGRAIVWKDIGPPGRKGKKKTVKFRDGSIISNKMGGKEIHYRSGWECEIYECLEALDEVAAYWAEPIRIPYLHEGEMHDYLPDLRIQFADGHVEMWEIKPANQTGLEKNQDKWNAATQYCRTRGWDFVVITEVGRDKLKQKVRDRRAGRR